MHLQRNQAMDIFLSYNSADHNVVENIARKLRDESLEPFLDRWHLAPGMRWRPKLEETLSSCKAVAIFVGPGEMGSWQQREVDVALDLQGRNPKLPVIPVLLPGCEPPLGFLRQLTWVDLRTQTPDRGIVISVKFQQRYQMRNRILSKAVPALEFCSFCSSQNCVLFVRQFWGFDSDHILQLFV
jgi:hypothetical protein